MNDIFRLGATHEVTRELDLILMYGEIKGLVDGIYELLKVGIILDLLN